MALARIGLGANLGDAAATVRAASDALGELGAVRARSALYGSTPWGGVAQPDFVNAAALLETALAPLPLLRALQALERRFGRVPGVRYGPRAIDLDLLAYDALSLATPELALPHPRLLERAFVLVPLAEIEPAFAAARDALGAADCDVWRIPFPEGRTSKT